MKKFIYTLLVAMFVLPISLTFAACTKTYNITFMVDGRVYETVQIKSDEPIKRIDDPSKEGYIFEGWYFSEAEDAQKFNFELYQIGSNVTLYARWSQSDYTIVYKNMTGATNDDRNPHYYSVETGTIHLWNASKDHYVFDGWYDNVDLVGEKVTMITQGTTGDISLYAKWIAVPFNITYNLNGGENDANNPSKYTIEDTIRLAAPTREHYDFAGWYTDSEFLHGPIDTITLGSTGNKILYAKWTIHNYTITYNLVGGENDNRNPSTYTHEDQDITLYSATKDYYNFITWQDENNIPIRTIYQGSEGDLNLRAVWHATDYAVIYHFIDGATNPLSNPTTYNIESDTIQLQPASKLAYTFKGWYDNEYLSGSQVTSIAAGSHGIKHLYAKWDAVKYSITYILNGGENDPDNPATYTYADEVDLLPATKTGYDFIGWHKREDLTDAIVQSIPYGSHETITLYAEWQLSTYTITYELVGGTNNINNPNSYHYTDATITLFDATKEGNTFLGWYNGTTKVTTIAHGSHENITLMAQWEVNEYSIYFNSNGGSPVSTITLEYNSTILVPNDPTRDGYTFAGWFINQTTQYEFPERMPAQNIDLVAHWNVVNYTINYHLNSEAGETNHESNPATYNIETAVPTLANPTKVVQGVAYTFLGWFTDPEFETAFTGIALNSTGAKDVYAKWELRVDNQSDLQKAVAFENVTIVLSGDINLTEALTINENVTLYLGNNTLTGANIDGAAIEVNDGATLNLYANNGGVVGGTGASCKAVRSYGLLNIYGGNYTVGKDADNEGNGCIEAWGEGVINIYGGTFSTEKDYNGLYYVLNQKNNATNSEIHVFGGTFINYNPENGDDVLAGNYVASGYHVVENDNGDGTYSYTVVED